MKYIEEKYFEVHFGGLIFERYIFGEACVRGEFCVSITIESNIISTRCMYLLYANLFCIFTCPFFSTFLPPQARRAQAYS